MDKDKPYFIGSIVSAVIFFVLAMIFMVLALKETKNEVPFANTVISTGVVLSALFLIGQLLIFISKKKS